MPEAALCAPAHLVLEYLAKLRKIALSWAKTNTGKIYDHH